MVANPNVVYLHNTIHVTPRYYRIKVGFVPQKERKRRQMQHNELHTTKNGQTVKDRRLMDILKCLTNNTKLKFRRKKKLFMQLRQHQPSAAALDYE